MCLYNSCVYEAFGRCAFPGKSVLTGLGFFQKSQAPVRGGFSRWLAERYVRFSSEVPDVKPSLVLNSLLFSAWPPSLASLFAS